MTPILPPARLDLTDPIRTRVLDAAARRLALADSLDVDLVLALDTAADALADFLDVAEAALEVPPGTTTALRMTVDTVDTVIYGPPATTLVDGVEVDLAVTPPVAWNAVATAPRPIGGGAVVAGPVVVVPVTAAMELALVILTVEGYRQPDQPWSILQDPNFGATRLNRDQLASVRSMVGSAKTRFPVA